MKYNKNDVEWNIGKKVCIWMFLGIIFEKEKEALTSILYAGLKQNIF